MNAASLRHRGALAGLLAVAVTVTACGGASGSGAAANPSAKLLATTSASAATSAPTASTSTPSASTAGASTTSAAAAVTGAPTSSASAAATRAPAAATTTKVKATGGGDFCKTLADAVNYTNSLTGASLKDQKAQIQKSLAQGAAALGKAPSAIKPDAVVVLSAVANLLKALEAANYDYTKIDPKALAAVSSPPVTAAEAHLETYVKANCGFSVTGG
ncbi:MAG: hypothetical protein QOE76_3766 [Frankiales bacterium]|nr:hypothetical protein [Frankiales bacterium]